MKPQLPENKLCTLLALCTMVILASCTSENPEKGVQYPLDVSLTKSELRNKIRGGWAGQVIGCTYGGPTEFDYEGTMIQDYVPIEWDDTRMEWYYDNAPGLYDDIYMDLTFVDVFGREGLDAPASSHAHAFANAGYMLWHANQAARYNILNGIEPPASGYWENNPHADDIDFQIEADFAGLMNPGMVNSASEVCDRVGHIMNYGDGWYGGVYVAAMYALSFCSDDPEVIVNEALKAIPEESQFYKCIHDVIGWHADFPDDWRRNWFEVQKKWSSDYGCPDGVFHPFDIDAKVNAAYIVIGLLYGEGDFGRTLEISTRCGQDSDCNPASAGGILGTILGYDQIPETWRQGLERVEDRDFRYTTMSLNDTYEMSYNQALEMIQRNGGEVSEDALKIHVEEPVPVSLEVAFKGHVPVKRTAVPWDENRITEKGPHQYSFGFEGIGFVLKGGVAREEGVNEDFTLLVDVLIDDRPAEEISLPTDYRKRRHDLAWKYNLEEGPHSVAVRWKNPREGYRINLNEIIVYASAEE